MNAAMKRDLKRFTQSIARWARTGERAQRDGEATIAATYQRDVADLRTLFELIRSGQIEQAAAMSDRLDTVVRDQIPIRLYNAIHGTAEKEAHR